jgi:type I restriction enzyme, S subunit
MSIIVYKEYKDSEAFWLNKIPVHWVVLPGKAIFSEKNIKNKGMIEQQVLSLSYGKIIIKPVEKLHGLVPESFETYQIVEPGDIIIRSTDLQNDKVSLRVGEVKDKGIITSAYLCFQPKPGILNKFGYLMLHTLDLTKVIYVLGSGLRQNLSWEDFKRFPFFIPSLNEQHQIVTYIEWKTAQINKFIKTKKQVIELLKEQKQVAIDEVVTGKIDFRTGLPYREYVETGVDWLSSIPKAWKMRRLKTIASVQASGVDKKSFPEEIPVLLCNYVDVYKNERITSHIKFMSATASPEEINSFKIMIDDVLITKDSESWKDIAVPAYVSDEVDAVCAYHLSLVRTKKKELAGEFLFYAFSSTQLSYQFKIAANGVTRFGLSQGAVRSGVFPIPPLSLQLDMCKYLTSSLRTIDLLIRKASQEIDTMKEYQTRLISDVVKGTVNVQGVKVPEYENVQLDIEIDENIEDEPDENIQ